MLIRSLFGMLLISLAAFACSGGAEKAKQLEEQQAAEKAVFDEVMAVHDEVMPEMGTINRLARDLKQKLETEEQLADEVKMQIEETIRELETADEGMMGWMAEFKQLDTLRETLDHDGVMSYLESEKQKIGQVRDQMLAGIRKGQELLETLNPTVEE